jgi:hypothetical protein
MTIDHRFCVSSRAIGQKWRTLIIHRFLSRQAQTAARCNFYIHWAHRQKHRNPFTEELLFWAVVMVVIHKSKFINPAQRSGDI